MRFLLAIVLALSPAAASAGPVTITWLGQSFFVIQSSQGTRVAIDPHGLEAFDRPVTRADLVLVTHPHPDHAKLDAIENKAKAKIHVGVRQTMSDDGKPPRSQWNPIDETFKDVRVRSVNLFHDNMQGMQRGKVSAFILEIDGLKIAHLGDLGHKLSEEQVRQIGPVDVVMVPVGGVYTLNGDAAKFVVNQLKPSRVILPMHYGVPRFSDLLPAEEFLDGQDTVRRMPTTNSLTVDAAEAKPPKPAVVVLGWESPKP